MSQMVQTPDAAVAETPLAAQLAAANPTLELKMHCGAQTPLRFAANPPGPASGEVDSLLHAAGVYDLGFRAVLRATGKDRVRWLNGMITQVVKGLNPGQTGYTLVLNPQGRIQGDADLFAFEEFLQLETDRSQSERLLTILRRYIIMDDVKLEALDAATTAMGIAGPKAPAILGQLGASSVPEPGNFQPARLAGIDVTLIGAYSPVVPRFEIHVPTVRVLDLWKALVDAGSAPCGTAALEDLRVLEGVARFEVDFSDKNLPQEANLLRALNFTKGCYIGQETVERIRARATLHRTMRHFELEGSASPLGPGEKIELRSGETAAGEVTSIASIEVPGFKKTLALGMVRTEALASAEPIRYDGGIALPLDAPPFVTPPQL
jgi:folate-binding protein YgfZ